MGSDPGTGERGDAQHAREGPGKGRGKPGTRSISVKQKEFDTLNEVVERLGIRVTDIERKVDTEGKKSADS